MKYDLDRLLKDTYKDGPEPSGELNRITLQRMEESSNYMKHHFRKTVMAAVIACVAVVGSVSAYAATQNFSLLSLFTAESADVKKNAENLLETEIKQEKSKDGKQSGWATFEIKEAICDKNQVFVQVAVKAAEPGKYLLVPNDLTPDEDYIGNLVQGLQKKQKIASYARETGKECLITGIYIDCDADSESIDYQTEKDGTLLYTIKFDNKKRKKNLDYVCITSIMPAEGKHDTDIIYDRINFTLTDKTDDVKVIKYIPVSDGKAAGTNLVIDGVSFEKSVLGMVCNVDYHYVGKAKKWEMTTDYDIAFYPLDSDGNIIESVGDGASSCDGTKVTQSWKYSLQDLPDTLTFEAKDVFEKVVYGTVDMKKVE